MGESAGGAVARLQDSQDVHASHSCVSLQHSPATGAFWPLENHTEMCYLERAHVSNNSKT